MPPRHPDLDPNAKSDSGHLLSLPCRVLQIQAMGSVRSFCFHRLVLLEQKFNLHVMMNADKEFLAQKSAPHRDFYNVRKVHLLLRRTHLRAVYATLQCHSRSMSQGHSHCFPCAYCSIRNDCFVVLAM